MRFTRAIAATVFLLGASAVYPAAAQRPGGVATVNGEAITNRDIEQRMRVSTVVFRQPLSRPAALQQLIDDKVKEIEARRIGMRVTDSHQNDMMTRLAASVRQQPAEFEQNLQRAGIEPDAVRAKISAEAIWGELLRVRGRSGNISNAELDAEVQKRAAQGGATIVDYVLRQVIFVVPPSSSPGQRERDANAARGRFTDCESGVEQMRQLRDVAVRERIGRTSSDLPKETQALLARTPIGRLTPPYRSSQGIEMLAVCEKNERQDIGRLRAEVEQELLSKRVEGTAASYLNELRAKVDIRR
jgi:peptidyl-prolyl cis-trans isomerase SurA